MLIFKINYHFLKFVRFTLFGRAEREVSVHKLVTDNKLIFLHFLRR